jgi:DNA-binding response OmpR family regulator
MSNQQQMKQGMALVSGSGQVTGDPRWALVIGCDPETVRALDRQASAAGWVVIVAADAQDALTSLSDIRPNLLLLDLDSTDSTRSAVADRLTGAGSNIPLLTMGEHPLPDSDELSRFPVLGHLVKPVDLVAVLRHIATAARK